MRAKQLLENSYTKLLTLKYPPSLGVNFLTPPVIIKYIAPTIIKMIDRTLMVMMITCIILVF